MCSSDLTFERCNNKIRAWQCGLVLGLQALMLLVEAKTEKFSSANRQKTSRWLQAMQRLMRQSGSKATELLSTFIQRLLFEEANADKPKTQDRFLIAG
mgnify:CR=1 FL=1